uniref:Ig-like domain-containing protein n=1 Tax=Sinocyclocheilus grahami TaxID=75366 RepID=A0A672PL20_SINGR
FCKTSVLFLFGFKDAVKSVSVTEGESVTLQTNVTGIQTRDLITWTFGHPETLIAKLSEEDSIFSTYDDVLDGRFRDRLKLDNQTGSLTIMNTRTTDSGNYKVNIKGTKPTTYRFNVTVYGESQLRVVLALCILFIRGTNLNMGFLPDYNDTIYIVFGETVSVMEGDSITLHPDVTEIREDDDIVWKYGAEKSHVAQINRDAKVCSTSDGPDGRFRDRLKLDYQTVSLTVTNISTQHAGDYELEINGEKLSSKTFMSVLEGDSVTLNSGFTEMMDDDLIRWRFGSENTLIAQINVMAGSITVYDDRFRDRLKLDDQTGSLIITNTRTEHTGVYKLQTNSVSKSFSLTVYGVFGESVSVMEGDSVTLHADVTEIRDDDYILWKFGAKKSLIAQIRRNFGIFNTFVGPDERFRDRLKLDKQTVSLTITNTSTEHAGDYKLEIHRAKPSSKTFSVFVYGDFCHHLHVFLNGLDFFFLLLSGKGDIFEFMSETEMRKFIICFIICCFFRGSHPLL